MAESLPPDRAIARAKSLAKRGEKDAARALLVEAARRFPKNMRVAKALAALDLPAVPPRSPQMAERVRTLGSLTAAGKLDAAIALGSQLAKALPNDPIVLYTLAVALLEKGETRAAMSLLEAVLRQAPTFARAWAAFGTALTKSERHHHAIRALNQALDLSPNDIDAMNSLGSSLRSLNRHEAAQAQFEAILKIADGPKVRKNLGTTLMELGHASEAAQEFRAGLTMAPQDCALHRDLSLVTRYNPGDPHLAEMERLAQAPGLSVAERAHLAFARAKAFDDIDARSDAFAAWSEGNRLRREEIGYDFAHEATRFETIGRLFRADIPPPQAFEPIPYRPVFIVGMPRSGTSLCEQILARHPKVWGAGELEDLRRAVASASEATGKRLSGEMVRQVRQNYLRALAEIGAPPGVVTDKMPSNFRFVGFVRLAFPEATIIHMRRDPMAVCWSLYRSYFSVKGHGYAYDLNDAADYYAFYDGLMRLYDRLWPGRIHTVDYDALTEEPETHVRALLEACDLPFDPACLAVEESKRAMRTVSALQVRRAIYTGSSEAWRRYEAFLEPLLTRLAAHGLIGPAHEDPS